MSVVLTPEPEFLLRIFLPVVADGRNLSGEFLQRFSSTLSDLSHSKHGSFTPSATCRRCLIVIVPIIQNYNPVSGKAWDPNSPPPRPHARLKLGIPRAMPSKSYNGSSSATP